MPNRRDFLRALAVLGAGACSPAFATKPRFAADPFRLGVASGYPSPNGVVLWTRLVADPLAVDGGLDPVRIPVRWEVARDDSMRDVAASGTAEASPRWAHSIHVEVNGLDPGRWYWYRFAAGDARSPIGRTRTAPSVRDPSGPLRFVFASCQHYEHGYYGAWRHAAADAPDLIAFLGDYIYENSGARNPVREHGTEEPYTLDAYRLRYALYRSDPDLQAAHAACPWIVTWDDHEVDNDYANDRPEDGMPAHEFLARRAAAYRAYYEHMPLPAGMRPAGARMRVYTTLDWGALARFAILDTRQYRSWQSCPRPGLTGGSNTLDVAECRELADMRRTMLGSAQERWLEAALLASPARWNVLAQQTPLAQFDQKPGPGRASWTDGWDGYPMARRRLLDFVADRGVANPVTLAGDVHTFAASDLKRDFDDPASPTVASELVASSVTSRAWPQHVLERFLPDNPHMLFANSGHRGYVRVALNPDALHADLCAMESVRTPDAACRTLASFTVESGRPGPRRSG